MAITRRFFLAGLGSVSVGLLFRRQLDAVLDSLERDLADEPQIPDQAPSAAEIVVQPQMAFRPERLVVASDCAPLFVLEDIRIGAQSQFAGGSVPAEMFTASAFDTSTNFPTVTAGTEIRFRVRYVGSDPAGARFVATLIGRVADEPKAADERAPASNPAAIAEAELHELTASLGTPAPRSIASAEDARVEILQSRRLRVGHRMALLAIDSGCPIVA
jgi:hypothetical protein